MLVMVVFFIAFRWIHLSTPLLTLFLLVLILLLLPTLNFLPVWFALGLLRFRLPSRLQIGRASCRHGLSSWGVSGARPHTSLRQADLTFGNLECAVSTRGQPFPKEYNFRATPAALAGLRRNSGIDVLNLANHHVGDYGPAATLDTVRGVERLGMKAVGAGPDL